MNHVHTFQIWGKASSGAVEGSNMSLSSSYNFNPNQSLPRECYCGKTIKCRTSWTRNNPGRRFLRCPNSLGVGRKCNFFLFIDPAIPNEWHNKLLYDMNLLFNEKYNEDFTDYKQLLEEDATEFANYKSKTEGKYQILEEELKGYKSKSIFYKRVLCLMIVIAVYYLFLLIYIPNFQLLYEMNE